MTSSPDAFVPAALGPAAANRPRVFAAAPVTTTSRPERTFTTFEVPADPAAVRVRESARAAGYAEGWSAGLRQAHERVEAERAAARVAEQEQAVREATQRAAVLRRSEDALLAAADELRARQDPTVGELADTVLALACDLAGAVLDRELALMDSPVLEAVKRALRPLEAADPVTVRVHPADLMGRPGDTLKDFAADADAGRVNFVADSSLHPGEAIARQGETTIDARLRASVARAVDALLGDTPGVVTDVSAEVGGAAA
ncbi:FliH/SctL family protein [Kineococcus gynurae]|uniref:FliH/SctL family protein n=1 Tax=Kineococcus gynurae TaxID=452979 RepID=A0ABV5LR57_9ACTN